MDLTSFAPKHGRVCKYVCRNERQSNDFFIPVAWPIVDVYEKDKTMSSETPSCKISLYYTLLTFGSLCVFVIFSCTRRWYCWKTCVRSTLRSYAGSGSVTHWMGTLSSLHFTKSCSSQTLIYTQWLLSEHSAQNILYTEYTDNLHLSSVDSYIFVILKQKVM